MEVFLTVLIIAAGITLPVLQLWLANNDHPKGWLRRKTAGYLDYYSGLRFY